MGIKLKQRSGNNVMPIAPPMIVDLSIVRGLTVRELQTLAFIALPAAPDRWEFRRGSDRTQQPG